MYGKVMKTYEISVRDGRVQIFWGTEAQRDHNGLRKRNC